jgi:type I restriction enzyme, R subunit
VLSKRELIDKFISELLPHIEDSDNIPEVFEKFWEEEKQKAISKLSTEENLDSDKLETVIGNYLFTEKQPLKDDLIGMVNRKVGLLDRSKVSLRLTDKIIGFVETFISGIARG